MVGHLSSMSNTTGDDWSCHYHLQMDEEKQLQNEFKQQEVHKDHDLVLRFVHCILLQSFSLLTEHICEMEINETQSQHRGLIHS